MDAAELTRDLAAIVRAGMQERGMSQRMLAYRAGVNHSAISRILAGDREPTLRTAVAPLSALGYTIEATPPVQVSLTVTAQ